jgi:hypothetical protein
MANDALRHYARRDLTFRSVSNIDGTDFVEVTRDIDAEQTLFIISSKTFRVSGRCSRDSAIGMSERLTPAALGHSSHCTNTASSPMLARPTR